MVGTRQSAGRDDDTPDEAMWASRLWLSRGLRLITYLVPIALSALAIFVAGRLWPQPRPAGSRVLWFGCLLLGGSAVSWTGHRLLQRLLPLALLLEMSLCFPESAPSRLRLARRGSSISELKLLMLAPPNETAQEAAERMLKLLSALSAHDRHTRGHAERVRAYADLIGESMGMPARDRDRLKWAALLHDIGKLHVPATLLNKPDKPDEDEWEILRAHPAAGDRIAAPLLDWLAPMDRVILEHHERWDGTGYPAGKSGREVSVGSRIVQVADAFEVMTAARPYKRPVRKDAALRELVRCAGTQFDPSVVRALVSVPNRWLLWAAGPAAWLAEIPLIGQNTVSLLGAAANQLTTVAASAAGATLVAAAALSPAPAVAGAVSPAHSQTQAVETGASVSVSGVPAPAAGDPFTSSASRGQVLPSSGPSARPSRGTPGSKPTATAVVTPVAAGPPAGAAPAPSASSGNGNGNGGNGNGGNGNGGTGKSSTGGGSNSNGGNGNGGNGNGGNGNGSAATAGPSSNVTSAAPAGSGNRHLK